MCGVRFQHELGIAQGTHFGDVQPFEFSRCRDPLPDNGVNRRVRYIGGSENETQQSTYANQLSHQLSRIAVEQSLNAVGAVGEQTDRNYAPQAAGAVNRNRADRIVYSNHAVDELDAQADQHAGRETDNDRAHGVDDSRWER